MVIIGGYRQQGEEQGTYVARGRLGHKACSVWQRLRGNLHARQRRALASRWGPGLGLCGGGQRSLLCYRKSFLEAFSGLAAVARLAFYRRSEPASRLAPERERGPVP